MSLDETVDKINSVLSGDDEGGSLETFKHIKFAEVTVSQCLYPQKDLKNHSENKYAAFSSTNDRNCFFSSVFVCLYGHSHHA